MEPEAVDGHFLEEDPLQGATPPDWVVEEIESSWGEDWWME